MKGGLTLEIKLESGQEIEATNTYGHVIGDEVVVSMNLTNNKIYSIYPPVLESDESKEHAPPPCKRAEIGDPAHFEFSGSGALPQGG